MRGADAIRTGLARRLRRAATNAEQRLWNRLRARQLEGHKFVRQQPLGGYVVDFLCREKRLVIEVDGGQHSDNPRDRVRDRWLREHNYRTIRFWNSDIMNDMNGVLQTIVEALRAEAPPHPVPAIGGNRPLPASGER
jgi:very-short-patch-repair endonuclease